MAGSVKDAQVSNKSIETWNLEDVNPRLPWRVLPLKDKVWDFPGSPVAKTLSSQCRKPKSDSWSEN